jgi:sirohydrochlorin ferrochelatase
MTMSRPQRQQLRAIAEDLLADHHFATVVAQFNEQALPARRHPKFFGRHHRPRAAHGARHRFNGACLIAVTLLVTAAVPGLLITAAVTHIPTFLAGIVLVVPAFLLFGRCWRRRVGADEFPYVPEHGDRVEQM